MGVNIDAGQVCKWADINMLRENVVCAKSAKWQYHTRMRRPSKTRKSGTLGERALE